VGIHAKVPPGFWDDIVGRLRHRFGAGQFAQGILDALREVGLQLKKHFPAPDGPNSNELSNEISFEDPETNETN
jgi:uncharacterized membrane protein